VTTTRPSTVAEGVYRLGTRWINFYLVEEQGEFTLIDAGYPSYWKHLVAAIDALGTSLGAIRAVILTHHHADHVGTAQRLNSTTGARVLIGAGDAWIVSGRYPSHANAGFYRQCALRPSGLRFLAHSAAAGGAKYHPVKAVETLTDDQTLDLPGRPRVIATPGHTAGHHAVALQDRSVLFSGDTMASFDYVTGRRGLGQHRLNDDRALALASLERFDGIDAETVLVAHGDPWTDGLHRALDVVRAGGQTHSEYGR
jgi:glyoxylase-like metal-dependent hydrolase (beta-lactamase superfamily II)